MRGFLLSLLLILAAVQAPANGQAEEADALESFGEVVDVSVVNVEVYVTDRDGNRVTGLGAEDFEVYEDGRRVQLTNFYEVTERAAGLELEELRTGQLEVGELTAEQRQLHLVIYVDNSNIQPFNRNRLFGHLNAFLHQHLAEGDRVAVYTFEKALNLQQEFTTDFSAVARALQGIEMMQGLGLTKESDRRDLLRDIERAQSVFEIRGRLQMHAENLYNDMQFTIGGMRQAVDNLAGLPGRKAILYVSDGVPMRAAEDLYAFAGDQFGDPSMVAEAVTFDSSRRFEELTAQANSNEVTLYTIQASGLRSFSTGSADSAAQQSNVAVDAVRRLNLQSPLLEMADQTGGVAIVGTSNFGDGLVKMGEDFEGYYSLGYSPVHGDSRGYHDIKVKVSRKGLDVRHREGYRAKSPEGWMIDRTTAALAYDFADNPLALEMEIAPVTPAEKGKFLVPVIVRVGLGEIVLLPDGEVHRGRLRLFVSAVDEEGRTAAMGDEPWLIEIPSERIEEARSKSFAHQVSLMMRPGAHEIAVGVRDELGAESSFRSKAILIQ